MVFGEAYQSYVKLSAENEDAKSDKIEVLRSPQGKSELVVSCSEAPEARNM